jgi:hypothetical protein
MGDSIKRSISIPRAFGVGKFEVTFEQWDVRIVRATLGGAADPDR